MEETPPPKRDKTLALIAQLRLLPYAPEIAEIVEVYFAHKLMPREAQGDADHLALASFYNCDMLVTWNCRHLANANNSVIFAVSTRCWGCECLPSSHRSSYSKKTMKTKYDDGLEWLREIRRKMSAKFDHDPRKAAAYYQKMQRRYAGRLYRRDQEVAAK